MNGSDSNPQIIYLVSKRGPGNLLWTRGEPARRPRPDSPRYGTAQVLQDKERKEPVRRALAEAQSGFESRGGAHFPSPAPGNAALGAEPGRSPLQLPRPPGAPKRGLPSPPPRLFPAQPEPRRSRLPIRPQSTSQPRPRPPCAWWEGAGRAGKGGEGWAGCPGPARCARVGRGEARTRCSAAATAPAGRSASGGRAGRGPAGEAARPRLQGGGRAGVAGEKSAARPRASPAATALSAGVG